MKFLLIFWNDGVIVCVWCRGERLKGGVGRLMGGCLLMIVNWMLYLLNEVLECDLYLLLFKFVFL